MDEPLLVAARKKFHRALIERGILTINANGIPSNADKGNRSSIRIALSVANAIGAEIGEKAAGQTSGANFESVVMEFLAETFPRLQNLRPGTWHIIKLGNRSAIKTSSFAQYEHLEYITELIETNSRLAASLGNDYVVAPDVVVYREPVSDKEINTPIVIVDEDVATLASIRDSVNHSPILHATVSAKWTMRSDRAQNSRTEALGLIRNRKGRVPHIVVVTGEPVPGRLASLALGTGDIDCMYHAALYELMDAVNSEGTEESREMLQTLVDGRRLKDITDLPLDLAV